MQRLILVIATLLFVSKTFAQTSITADSAYQGNYATGEYEIYQSQFSTTTISSIRKPIIFVEGIDANNVYSISDLHNIIYRVPIGGTSSLGASLNAQGYDIVILNFGDGGDYIQKNSFLLMKLINLINAGKPNTNPLVVMGFSMGGVVARYALAYMEAHNIDHQTRLYVSFDAPHKGAHIPASVQSLALAFNSPAYLGLFPDLQQSLNNFLCPAASQLLRYRIGYNTPSGNLPMDSGYIKFMNEMNSLNSCHGFPTKCRNVAASLGNWSGIPQRSNLDLDGDGIKDYQYAGVPTAYINIPQDSTQSSQVQPIWDLNPCQITSAFSFQVLFAAAGSKNYPYYQNRANATGLKDTNKMYSTIYFINNLNIPVFPPTYYMNIVYGSNGEPTDFEPGSYSDAYEQIVDGINSEVRCSYAVSSNCTFIPTVSALCFDTDDPFHDIRGDASKMNKTPFDAIYGINGDNLSHVANQTSNLGVNTFIYNEIIGNYGKPCAMSLRTLTGTAPSGTVNYNDATTVVTSNYTVNSSTTETITAPNYILLSPQTIISSSNYFLAQIGACTVNTPCAYNNTYPMLRYVKQPDTSSAYTDFTFVGPDTHGGLSDKVTSPITVAPNPNGGTFTISSPYTKASYFVENMMGQIVTFGELIKGRNTVTTKVSPGVYLLHVKNQSYQQTVKLVIQ